MQEIEKILTHPGEQAKEQRAAHKGGDEFGLGLLADKKLRALAGTDSMSVG